MSDTLQLLKKLIELRSITPDDAGCQKLLMQRLKKAGFHCERLAFDGVENFWAYHGEAQPRIIFAGHTDVVPPGDEKNWKFPPFSATEHDGYLYGRGAADMKSGLAAMVVAAENFVKKNPQHNGSIGFIVTSDEEGPAINGTVKVVDYLQQKKIKLDYGVVGEASSNKQLGDAIKIGRRGSMHGDLTIIGKQGHIAYPHLADNPIHRAFQAFDVLAKTEWDKGNEYFTPTSFQFYHIHADGGAANVIPAALKTKFNFRYAPIYSTEQLQQKCEQILDQHQLKYELKWNVSSQPFFSGNGKLATLCKQAIKEICHLDTEPNTYGGTSDGRFIAATGCEVIELGPVNATAHHVNENTRIADLDKLSQIYQRLLELILI
jgi:succinyl-diaminopimelate desuccinylase